MANEIITTDLTTVYSIDTQDYVYFSADASLITGGASIVLSPNAASIYLQMDGDVVSMSGFSAIDLSSTSTTGNVNVTIGQTGSVTALVGRAVNIEEDFSTFVNYGQVTATGSTAVYMAVDSVGNAGGSTFQNFGAIGGYSGVVLVGKGFEGLNAGTLDGKDYGAQLLNFDNSSFVNSGLVTSMEDGIYVHGISPDISNSGRIDALGKGIAVQSATAIITNSGTITAGGSGISPSGNLSGSGLFVTNSGSITADEDGINTSSVTATINITATGEVIAGGVGLRVNGNGSSVQVDGMVSAFGEGLALTANGLKLAVGGQVISHGSRGIYIDGDASQTTITGQVTGNTGLLVLGASAKVNNSGTITGNTVGVTLSTFDPVTPVVGPLRLTNSGTIQGQSGAVTSDVGLLTLSNSGQIIAGEGNAISTGNAAKITNTGLISAGPGGSAFVSFGTEIDVFKNHGTVVGSLSMGKGNDTVRNSGMIDGAVRLSDGNDLYNGRQGWTDGFIKGEGGNDTLIGGAEADTLQGGGGYDSLTGGAGPDVFYFATAAEASSGGFVDVLTDFKSGEDKINLSAFMANATFIGSANFTGANQVRYDPTTGNLRGEIDGVGTGDWVLYLSNKPASLSAEDFIF